MSTTSTPQPTAKFMPAFSKVSTSVDAPPSEARAQVPTLSTSTVLLSAVAQTSTTELGETAPSATAPSPGAASAVGVQQQAGGVPATAFYGFAAAIGGLILLGGGLWCYRRVSARAKKADELENAVRARELAQRPMLPGLTPDDVQPPLSGARSWTSSEWDARSNVTPRRLLPPSAARPAPGRSALQHIERRRNPDADAKAEAQRRARFTALTQADEVERERSATPYEPTASSTSEFDLERRGPAVNAEYAAARERVFQRKLAQGMSVEQAMTASDAGTDAGDGPVRPLAARGQVQVTPAAQPPRARSQVQLAPDTTPGRWASPTAGLARPSQEDTLVEEADSDRLSQVELAFTEDDTATRASTLISNDPWRDEVLLNRRRGV
ncbi:MAG: hypothetical protein M1832_003354 [Thelocarpon impressellum]|nr:MAG: hypothetical protein M1832_003354 [Thelocarpon impressellum]